MNKQVMSIMLVGLHLNTGKSVSKYLLGSIHHVEEPVFVAVVLVHLSKSIGDIGKGTLVDEEEKCLSRVQLQPPPYNLDKFSHGNMIWNKEFCFIQKREMPLARVSFYYHWNFIWVLFSNLFNIPLTLGEISPFPERFGLSVHGWRLKWQLISIQKAVTILW